MSDEQLATAFMEAWVVLAQEKRALMLDILWIARLMRDLQKRMSSQYGYCALFEDNYIATTAASYLAEGAACLLRAMRCIEGDTRHNHVEAGGESRLYKSEGHD